MKALFVYAPLASALLFNFGCQKAPLKSDAKADEAESTEEVKATSAEEKDFEKNALALFAGGKTQFGVKSGKMSNGEVAACFYYSTNLIGQNPKIYYGDEKKLEAKQAEDKETPVPSSKSSVSPMLKFALRIQKDTFKKIITSALKEEKALKSAQIYHSALGGFQTAAGASLAILGAAALTAGGLPFALPAELAALDLVPIGALLEFLAVSGQLGAGIEFLDAKKVTKQLEQKEYKFSDLTWSQRQSLRKYSDLAVKSASESKYDLFNNIPSEISEALARAVQSYPKEDLTQIKCSGSGENTQFSL
jgi:hypothetical protein